MSGDRPWCDLPEARRAAATGDFGTLLRIARAAARLTLVEAGQRCGYSAATLSRIERGRQRLTDVMVLRRLAEIFDIPPALFGLVDGNDPTFNRFGSSLDKVRSGEAWHEDGEDPVRRRDVLGGLAGLVGAALPAPGDAVAAPSRVVVSLEDVLLDTYQMQIGPVDRGHLQRLIAGAWTDFNACRYARLSARLPQLVATAAASHAVADGEQRCLAAGLLTRTYHLTTQLLIKLHENGMAWSAMDRANQAARAADDPLLHAETARVTAIVLRRSHHRQRAQQTIIRGAEALDRATNMRSPEQVTAYGRLLATAAYTAALADRRDTAWDLLGEADEARRRAGVRAGFGAVDIALYKIGVARVLGDFGAAVEHARSVRPDQLDNVERRARYWEDAALALYGRGAYSDAYRALLSAEQTAPQEVRYRPWAQHLTTALLSADRRQSLTDLRGFAARIGVTG